MGTVVLGILGLVQAPAFAEAWETNGWWAASTDMLFSAVGLLAFAQPVKPPTNAAFGIARVLGVLFALAAAGSIVLSLSSVIRTRIALWSIHRRSRRTPENGHTVLVGLGPVALGLIDDVCTSSADSAAPARDVIAMSRTPDASAQDDAQDRGALVLAGDLRTQTARQHMRLETAREVFFLTRNDARNLDLAESLLRDMEAADAPGTAGVLRAPDASRLQVYVQIQNPAYAALFREMEFFRETEAPVDVHVVDLYERAAQDLLLDPEHGLATAYAPPADAVPHIVLFGFGEMGQSVALEAGRLCHFPGETRLRMSIVHAPSQNPPPAREADGPWHSFLSRVPTFSPKSLDLLAHAQSNASDKDAWSFRGYRPFCKSIRRPSPATEYVVNAEFLARPADDPDLVRDLLRRFTVPTDARVAPFIIVAFDEEERTFETAHRLRSLLMMQDVPEALGRIPIYAYLPNEKGLESLLAEGVQPDSTARGRFLMHAFGRDRQIANHAQITRSKLLDLAKAINEGYAERYSGASSLPSRNELWRTLSTPFRASNEDAAAHAAVKLRWAGYRWSPFRDLSDSESIPAADISLDDDAYRTLARVEHNRFVAERLLAGWTYDAPPQGYTALSPMEKNAVKRDMKDRKRRFSLVPYSDLLPEDVPKDRTQIDVILQALARAGQRVVKVESARR